LENRLALGLLPKEGPLNTRVFRDCQSTRTVPMKAEIDLTRAVLEEAKVLGSVPVHLLDLQGHQALAFLVENIERQAIVTHVKKHVTL
jgi:hypothetical protein